MNLFPFAIPVLLLLYISPILTESPASSFIRAMLPKDGKFEETMSTDDLAEAIYQNLIKRKLSSNDKAVEDDALAEEVRQELVKEAFEASKRKERAKRFLQKLKHGSQRRRRLLKIRKRLVK